MNLAQQLVDHLLEAGMYLTRPEIEAIEKEGYDACVASTPIDANPYASGITGAFGLRPAKFNIWNRGWRRAKVSRAGG